MFNLQVSLAFKSGIKHTGWLMADDCGKRMVLDRAALKEMVLKQMNRDELVGLVIAPAEQTFTIFYWYQCVDGGHVPASKTCSVGTFEEAKAKVVEDFRDSVTPIVRFVEPKDYTSHLVLLTKLLALTKPEQTGMLHSLEWTRDVLMEVLGLGK